MFVLQHHTFVTIVWHHTSRIIVIYVGKTTNHDLLIFAFVEKMWEVYLGQLGKTENLWNARESHWNEILRVDEINFRKGHLYAKNIWNIHDPFGKILFSNMNLTMR